MKMKAQHTWNFRGTIKVLLRGKFIPLMASLEKLESPHSKNLKLHLKALVKEANAHKRSRQQETIQIRTELNQLDTKKTTKRINKIKSWFFEKINKIDKPLAKLTKRQRDSIQINKIRKERGYITTDTQKIQRINRFYWKTCIHKVGKSQWNGLSFSKQIPLTKVKSRPGKLFKQSYNP